MKRMLFVFFLAAAIVGCQKTYELRQNYFSQDFFYRIAAYDGGGNIVDYSYIVTTKVEVGQITGEFRGETNTGNKGGHHDGDDCDEDKPDFCQKHPWHKKCQALGLRMDELVAQRNKDHIAVSWRMQNEGSIAEFSVERSENGRDFISRKRVKSTGNNSNYIFKDYNK